MSNEQDHGQNDPDFCSSVPALERIVNEGTSLSLNGQPILPVYDSSVVISLSLD